MKELKITAADGRKISVTHQDIDDILASALEGGINYWCRRAEVRGDYLGEYASDQISRNGILRLHLIEPFDKDDTRWYDLTLDKFMDGLKMYLDNEDAPYDITEDHEGRLCIDAGMCDADVSDMIVQYALWNELVFG